MDATKKAVSVKVATTDVPAQPKSQTGETAPTAAKIGITKFPYELVRPRLAANLSWEGEASVMTVGQRWWYSRSKKKRKHTLWIVLVFFTIIFSLVIALISVGFGAMFSKPGFVIDPRLKAKTSLCHAQYPLYADCVMADEHYSDVRSLCEEDQPICKAHLVKIRTTGGEFVIEAAPKRFPLSHTDYSECDYLKWCVHDECVDSGLTANQWFPKEHQAMEEGRQWLRISLDELTCLETNTSMSQLWMDLRHELATCVPDECSKGFLRAVFKFIANKCDMRPDEDKKSGLLFSYCEEVKGAPLEIEVCKWCDNFDPSSASMHMADMLSMLDCRAKDVRYLNKRCTISCATNNSTVQMPNGFPCDDNNAAAFCVLGYCYTPKGKP